MTFSMCLPHLHPFWVNQKKKEKKKKCWEEMCYPFKSQNRGSQLRANPENCTDEIRAWQKELLQEKRCSNFWARKGQEGTWDQSACPSAKAFSRDPARAYSFWPRDIPKALFLYHEYVPVGWCKCHYLFNFIIEENTDFQRESLSLLFCFHRWLKPQL